MTEQLGNLAEGTLNTTMNDSVTTLVLDSGQGAKFPSSGDFRITVEDEIMLCTSRSTDTLTVVRSQEGTTNVAHTSGVAVAHTLTKGGLDQYLVEGYATKPTSISSGEAPVWNGSAFVRSTTTGLGLSSLAQDGAITGDSIIWSGSAWAVDKSSRVLSRSTGGVDVVSTTSETTLFTYSVPAGIMASDRQLRLTLRGDWLYNNSNTNTITFRIKFGGTTFIATPAMAGFATSSARQPWRFNVEVANLGSSSSQYINFEWMADRMNPNGAAMATGIGSGGFNVGSVTGVFGGISTLGTINTGSTATIEVTAQWNTSSANNSWRQRYGVLELV